MHRRFHEFAAILTAALATGGCVQMTRHSNTVVFGTNSSIGIRVGASASSVPEVQVGYSRQEAVVMPLVANTRNSQAPSGDLLQPCDIT